MRYHFDLIRLRPIHVVAEPDANALASLFFLLKSKSAKFDTGSPSWIQSQVVTSLMIHITQNKNESETENSLKLKHFYAVNLSAVKKTRHKLQYLFHERDRPITRSGLSNTLALRPQLSPLPVPSTCTGPLNSSDTNDSTNQSERLLWLYRPRQLYCSDPFEFYFWFTRPRVICLIAIQTENQMLPCFYLVPWN